MRYSSIIDSGTVITGKVFPVLN